MNLEIQTISKDRIYYRGEIMLRKRKKESTLNRILEVPKEICTNEPKLTIAGFKKMLIENYKVILEYQDIFSLLEKFYLKIKFSIYLVQKKQLLLR